jgi:hypothetical protein
MATVTGVCASCRKPGVGNGIKVGFAWEKVKGERGKVNFFIPFALCPFPLSLIIYSPIPIKSMQPTISIPKHWDYPRFALEQRTQQGIILGLQYYPTGTELAEQFGKNSDELFHFQENQIKPLSPEELLSEITAEIKFYQQQITILQQHLDAMTGGFTNA